MFTHYKKLRFVLCGVFVFGILLLAVQCLTSWMIVYKTELILCNEGISFGIMVPQILFWIVWIAILGGLLVLYVRRWKEGFIKQLPYILIITGGVSNIVDRMIYGCVVDYVRIIPWNVFNLADVLIFLGVIILIYQSVARRSP